jgi:hypothetical protein
MKTLGAITAGLIAPRGSERAMNNPLHRAEQTKSIARPPVYVLQFLYGLSTRLALK